MCVLSFINLQLPTFFKMYGMYKVEICFRIIEHPVPKSDFFNVEIFKLVNRLQARAENLWVI